MILLAALTVATRRGPWRWLQAVLALGTMAGAAYAVVWLSRLSTWPDLWVRAFSRVRQQLWSEALGLWALSPATGGGAGSYAESNPLARDPDTAAAHSSVLQTGAEFGVVGLALFGLVLVAGLALALSRDAARGLVATAAWTAVFVHSVQDHLYDFGSVVLFAAMVLGSASASRRVPRPPASGATGTPAAGSGRAAAW